MFGALPYGSLEPDSASIDRMPASRGPRCWTTTAATVSGVDVAEIVVHEDVAETADLSPRYRPEFLLELIGA
jgi:hypothetical protein